MLTYYYTIKEAGTHEINIQKSRFIGYVKRVTTEEEAQTFIEQIKKKHHDATHNCTAYIIGDHDQIQKANDDGEPSGTAGVPMLEVLKRQNLKNTAVVVTRYFGGVKLGAGGLIRAYSTTTSETIKAVGIVKRQLMQGFSVTVDYPQLGMLENAIHQSNHLLEHINYLENVELTIFVQTEKIDSFKKWITNLTSDQATVVKTEKKYVEKEVSSTKE